MSEIDLTEIHTEFPKAKLKFCVERKTEKISIDSIDLPSVGLSDVEKNTGKLKENDENESVSGEGIKFEPGDVLFGKLRPYLTKSFIANKEGVASPEFLVLTPKEFTPEYLLYLFLSKEFVEKVDASTVGAQMPRASWNFIGEMRVPNPDINKQHIISEQLGSQIKRINENIERLYKIQSLTHEKLDVFREQHVSTSQSDHNKKEPDSIWLNELPEHWDVTKLAWVTKKIGSGLTPDGGSESYVEEGINFIRSQNVKETGLSLEDIVYIPEETHREMQTTQLEKDDILLNITGASIGRSSIVTEEVLPGNVNQHVCILRPNKSYLVPSYLNELMSSNIVQNQIFANQTGASRQAVTFSQIGNFEIPLPPKEEQKRISHDLDDASESLRGFTLDIEKTVDLLEEKRQALITAAVTGQIDISEEKGVIQGDD